MSTSIPQASLKFLQDLAQNNHKDWMDANRATYKASEKELKKFYATVEAGLNKTDEIAKVKVFRINRDIRFSKDKTPYNVHRSVSFSRAGAHRRGGYYLRIEPGDKSVVAGGFFGPEPADLLRIRKEFEMDASEIRKILAHPPFKKVYGGTFDAWDPVKTAPKGFSKDDPNIDLIRLKNFVVTHSFTDAEVLAPDFAETVVHHFELLRPFFDYMSEVLTTDLNGVSTIS
jgi:uncharacterized protein (TIGR02453 family)|tara:strand:- start:152636 stop:153322 length:687 start_codon:yes stop_codon:yes gene_type:complete